MSERKVINKYYPPDFDPLQAEKELKKANKSLKRRNNGAVTVRLMTPFSIRCLKCDEYIPQSRKFNGKKEVLDEKYLETFKIYRLNIKCPRCSNSIAFRTDPQSSDYVMEFGGIRNYSARISENKNIETVDQTLQRLANEYENNQSRGEDKMQVLEDRLSKLQREQEGDQELMSLKDVKSQQRRREDHLYSQNVSDGGNHDDVEELDRLAESAFEQKKRETNTIGVCKPVKKISRVTKTQCNTSNPLGVRIKR